MEAFHWRGQILEEIMSKGVKEKLGDDIRCRKTGIDERDRKGVWDI